MSRKSPTRCLLCGDVLAPCCGIVVDLRGLDGLRRFSWHLDCAERDALHEGLADACAALDRAEGQEATTAAEDAVAGATLAIFAVIGERHPTRMDAVWRSILRR